MLIELWGVRGKLAEQNECSSIKTISSEISMAKQYYLFTKKWIIRGWEIFTKLWEINFFFFNIHVPLVVLVFNFLSFRLFYLHILTIPVGVTYIFVSRFLKYLSLLLIGSSIICIVFVKLSNGGKLALKNQSVKISRGDLTLLLLPLTPVIQYIFNNQDILSPFDSLYVFALFVLFSGFYVLLIPALLGFIGSTRTLVTSGLAFTLTITIMALLTHSFTWYGKGSLKVQAMVYSSVFLATRLFFDLYNKELLRFLILVVFVTNNITQLVSENDRMVGTNLPAAENKLLSLIEERKLDITLNIYLLVYDSYVANETMLSYSIDNSGQEKYLKETGFKLYPHTYSVAANSTGTMSRVLNVSTDYYGDKRKGASGDGIIQNTLSNFGYRTYGLFISDHYFRGIDPTYDFSIPGRPSSPDILSEAIFMGEFRFDVGFDTLSREQFVEIKHNIFEGVSGDPVFIYMHSNLPGHSQNSGMCLPDEIDLYNKRLSNANSEMRQDIETIIKNDLEAIIIVAGDHGPYLTKNCYSLENFDESEISRLDIQDRYGTFLAIRWPTEDYEKYDEITVLQDLFPAIFGYLFNDERFLESKIEPSTFSEIVKVQNGIIYGGIDDGEPLFLTDK